MPTYDYECDNCGYEFEAFHGMSAKPLIDCPECNQSKLIKLIGSGAAVIIRGIENPCRGTRGSKDRLGEGKNKGKKPFWRDGPVNKKVLKDPEKYVKTGKVD